MRVALFASVFCLMSGLAAQEIAKPTNAVAYATSGQFVISTRAATTNGQAAPPEIFEVITGDDGGAAITMGALGSVKLEANTQVRLPTANAPQSLELLKGKLFLNVDAAELAKHQNAEFRLKTPAALLAVKGTRFFVAAQGGTESLGVHEGATAIINGSGASSLLKQGQITSYVSKQPIQIRAMTVEEAALDAQYAATLPLKTPLAILVSDGSSNVVTYYHQGRVSSVPKDDTAAIEQLGASVLLAPITPTGSHMAPTEGGTVQLTSSGTATKHSVGLTLPTEATSQPFALQFFLRAAPSVAVTVNGRLVKMATSTVPPAGRPVPWTDCLIDLKKSQRRPLVIEVESLAPTKSSRSKTDSKTPIVEFSGFSLLFPPVEKK